MESDRNRKRRSAWNVLLLVAVGVMFLLRPTVGVAQSTGPVAPDVRSVICDALRRIETAVGQRDVARQVIAQYLARFGCTGPGPITTTSSVPGASSTTVTSGPTTTTLPGTPTLPTSSTMLPPCPTSIPGVSTTSTSVPSPCIP